MALPSTGADLLAENAEFLERDGNDVVIGDYYVLPSEPFQMEHLSI